jgi:L-alanine-DL-glutamate epimerase-like enolase superfamily enzyme
VVSLERLEVVPVRIPMEGGAHEAVIVIQHGDDAIGLGEAPVVAGRGDSLPALVAELLGKTPPRSAAARFALETARLDLQARQEGRPLAALLGAPQRRVVECSALLTASRPDLVAREAERCAAAGFTAFKLKAANGGGIVDQERLGAARWAAGPSARLRLDFNGRLGAAEVMARLAGLAPFRLELVEQPLPADAPLGAWQALRAAGSTLLAADESLAQASLARELAAAGVTLAIKLATVGGLLAACELARQASGPLTVGSSFETSIGLAAALHLACALPSEPLACGLATGRLLDDDLATGLTLRGAHLQLPDQPGLGVTLDRRGLELYRLDR